MSLLNYFCDWLTTATIKTLTQVPDANGHMTNSYAGTATVKGVLHTASTNETYFSQTWTTDTTKVFKTDSITGITTDSYLEIDGIRYSISGIDNVNEQDDTYVIGLKVHQ